MASRYPSPSPTPTPSDDWWTEAQSRDTPVRAARRRSVPAVIPGPPKPVDPIQQQRDVVGLARDQQALADARRPDVPSGYRFKQDGTLEPIPGGPADPTKAPTTRPLPETARTRLESNVGVYEGYQRSRQTFQDDYGGNVLGEAENIGQSYFDIGTPGQRQWWADFRQNDNQIRHDLYGSAFTATEKANYDKTTITPGMSPATIRANLAERQEIVRRALARQVGVYRANGFAPDAVDAAAGEYIADFSPDYSPDGQPGPVQGAEAGAREGAEAGERINGVAPEEQQRDPLFGQGRTMQSDEQGQFAMDGPAPPRAKRFPAAQEAEILQAIRDGDVGQAAMLTERYSGKPADRAGLQMAADAYRKDPKTPLYLSYSAGDELAQSEYDLERYGEYLKPAIEDRKKTGRGVDSFVRQAANAPTLGVADILEAGSDTVFGGGKGENFGQRYRDNLRKQRALTEADYRVNPGYAWSGTIIGGLALPTKVGPVGGAARDAALAGGAGIREAARAARSAGARRLGLEGAAYGGVTGTISNIETSNPLGHGAVGALQGAVGGYGIGRALGGRLPPKVPGGDEAIGLARAAEEEGVQISRPIVDPGSRDAMRYLESSFGSGGVVQRSLKGTEEGIEHRAGALGAGGTAMDEAGIGGVIQNAGRRFIDRTRTRAEKLYDRAAQMAGNAPVRASNALKALDEQIVDLSENANANAPLISYLKEIRGDFADAAGNLMPKTVSSIRELRKGMRGQISTRGLSATDADRRIGAVLDAATTDIQRDLGMANPAAVKQYARADQYYRQRQSEIKNVVQRVLGQSRQPQDQISPEKAWSTIRTMAGPKGDSDALSRMWAKLEPQEQMDAAATLAENFGRRAADEAFSPSQFIASTRGLSKAARETIFGPEGARSISNLRELSRALTDTRRSLKNTNSGFVQNWNQFLNSVAKWGPGIGGTGGGIAGGLPGAIVGAAAGTAATSAIAGVRNISARALMSPNMSKWLVEAAHANSPGRIMKAIQKLAVIATRDPAVAQEALGLQDDLRKALGEEKPKGTAIPVGRRGDR